MIFRRKKEAKNAAPKEPWPSALNPCLSLPCRQAGGRQACRGQNHATALSFDVQGKTTLLCANCLADFEEKLREKQVPSPRLAALAWFFLPDPSGRDCIYTASCPRHSIPKKPAWVEE